MSRFIRQEVIQLCKKQFNGILKSKLTVSTKIPRWCVDYPPGILKNDYSREK